MSEGSERGEWSEYSENTIKEFTGLHEGKYVFSVKLMTDKDQELVMTSFSFEILPPWYRTWWSYLICSRCGFTTILYSLSHSCQPEASVDAKRAGALQAETRIQERE